MRLALFAALALCTAGCSTGPSTVYTHEPGQFDPDEVPGIERLDVLAAAGDADAQFQVAYYRQLMTGHAEAAIPVFERLAEADHRGSIEMLAYAYRDGKGVAVDHERAAYWLGRAAVLGDERAANDLAVYRSHRGDADA